MGAYPGHYGIHIYISDPDLDVHTDGNPQAVLLCMARIGIVPRPFKRRKGLVHTCNVLQAHALGDPKKVIGYYHILSAYHP